MVFVSQAPLEKLQAYKRRMGWVFPWVSSAHSEFNVDLGFSSSEERTREWVTPMLEQLPLIAGRNASDSGTDLVGYLTERQGFSAFVLDDGAVYQTYSTGARGGRVSDGLLRDPRPSAERPRRGRRVPALDPPPRRVRPRVTIETEDVSLALAGPPRPDASFDYLGENAKATSSM
jgi:hypothetical protein